MALVASTVGNVASAFKNQKLQTDLSNAKLKLSQLETENLRIKNEHLQLVAKAADQRSEALEKISNLNQELQSARERETQLNSKLDSSIRAANRRLLDDSKRFATGNTTESGDTIAACRGRATTLQLLLEEAVSVAEEATVGAEQCGTDLRTMLEASSRLKDLDSNNKPATDSLEIPQADNLEVASNEETEV